MNDFIEHAYSAKECRKMLWEARELDRQLVDNEVDLKVLRSELGLIESCQDDNNLVVEEDPDNTEDKMRIRNKAVGKRDPVRDPVGVKLNDIATS